MVFKQIVQSYRLLWILKHLVKHRTYPICLILPDFFLLENAVYLPAIADLDSEAVPAQRFIHLGEFMHIDVDLVQRFVVFFVAV